MANPELLIGLVAIAVTIFLGLASIAVAVFVGLKEFRKGIMSELSTIKDSVIAIRTTVDKTWDIIALRFAPGSGTVERQLGNLGKVKISAEPGRDQTTYLVEIEKPILKGAYIAKIRQETGLTAKEIKLFGKESAHNVLSTTILRLYVPSADPKICTEYVTQFLNWLDSTYIESLQKLGEFEEPILK